MSYDDNNRLISVNDDGLVRNFAYDNRGNVTNNGRDSFVYDRANQPTSVVGKETYTYDGNFRRVKQVTNTGKTIFSFYSYTGGIDIP